MGDEPIELGDFQVYVDGKLLGEATEVTIEGDEGAVEVPTSVGSVTLKLGLRARFKMWLIFRRIKREEKQKARRIRECIRNRVN